MYYSNWCVMSYMLFLACFTKCSVKCTHRIRVTLTRNVSTSSKKSDIVPKSELVIKTCSVNAAIVTSELSHHVLCVVVGQVSWHFILPVRFSYLGVMRMRTLTLHPFTHAEQLYLMYLHYCKGRFRVGVGVDVNKTGSIFRCRIVLPT